jgi:hypothetical protein
LAIAIGGCRGSRGAFRLCQHIGFQSYAFVPLPQERGWGQHRPPRNEHLGRRMKTEPPKVRVRLHRVIAPRIADTDLGCHAAPVAADLGYDAAPAATAALCRYNERNTIQVPSPHHTRSAWQCAQPRTTPRPPQLLSCRTRIPISHPTVPLAKPTVLTGV